MRSWWASTARRDLAHPLDAQQQPRAVRGMALDQRRSAGMQLAAADQDVIGQRLLAEVVQQPRGVNDRLLALRQPGRARELVRVVRDGRRVARRARVAQRERLQQQPEHSFVAHVELVGAALDLLRMHLALEQRSRQNNWYDAQREREQPDDPGPSTSKPSDGRRRRGDLPRQHRDQPGSGTSTAMSPPPQDAACAHDHQSSDVRRIQERRRRDREAAVLRIESFIVGTDAAQSSRNVVFMSRLLEQVGPRAHAGAARGGTHQPEDAAPRTQQHHGQHDP